MLCNGGCGEKASGASQNLRTCCMQLGWHFLMDFIRKMTKMIHGKSIVLVDKSVQKPGHFAIMLNFSLLTPRDIISSIHPPNVRKSSPLQIISGSKRDLQISPSAL